MQTLCARLPCCVAITVAKRTISAMTHILLHTVQIGMRFMHPPTDNKFLEVIGGKGTSDYVRHCHT